MTQRGPRKRGTFRKESVKLEQVCSRRGEGWRKRQNHWSWLSSPSEHAQAANYHLCTVLKQEWLVCSAHATPKLSGEPTGQHRGPATKKNPRNFGKQKRECASTKWSTAWPESTTKVNNNANIQDGPERFCKRLWKGKYKTEGTTASTTVRLINDSWAETFTLPKWQLRKQRNRRRCPNQTRTLRLVLIIHSVTHKPLMLVRDHKLTLEILKIHIFSWSVFRKRSCQSRGFSGWLKAVLFWGNCKLTLRKQSYCLGILFPLGCQRWCDLPGFTYLLEGKCEYDLFVEERFNE